MEPNGSKLSDEDLSKLKERVASATKKRSAAVPESKSFDFAAYARRVNGEIETTTQFSEKKKQERINKELAEWHERVGERFAYAKIENPEIHKRIEKKINNMKKGLKHANSLLLVGELGVGKTWTSYAYIEWMIREGLVANSEVFMGTEAEVLKPITQAGFRQPEEEAKLLDRRYKVYFIDEVGRAKYRDQESQHTLWAMLINHAYQFHLPVIITSNLPTNVEQIKNFDGTTTEMSRFAMWLGDAAADRFRHMVGDGFIADPFGGNKRGETNKFFDSGKTNRDL